MRRQLSGVHFCRFAAGDADGGAVRRRTLASTAARSIRRPTRARTSTSSRAAAGWPRIPSRPIGSAGAASRKCSIATSRSCDASSRNRPGGDGDGPPETLVTSPDATAICRKARDYYAACMDVDGDHRGRDCGRLVAELAQINALDRRDALPELVAHLQAIVGETPPPAARAAPAYYVFFRLGSRPKFERRDDGGGGRRCPTASRCRAATTT